jgi:hypothetical protein
MTQEPDGDDVSQETLMAAEQVRARAAGLPDAGEIARMAIDAAAGKEMTPDEIRALGSAAVRQASQVAFLLGRLAALLDQPGDPHVEG